MKTNVISPEYLKLQEDISKVNKAGLERLSQQEIVIKKDSNIKGYPLLPQQELHINVRDYRSFIEDLIHIIQDNIAESAQELDKLKTVLDDECLEKWAKEAIAVNSYYFSDFAKEHDLPEWLPLFIAESAVRPFIQKATQELEEQITVEKGHKGSCPVCGEPPRLAVINKEGKKEITCPRCHFSWEEKKISCAHCGTEEPGQVIVLRVEDDDSAEIYACKSCKGYTKLIDIRKLLKVSSPEILDLKTIHLDYIAQEHGYGFIEDEETSH
ncbi:formate dehydrogenase accessory protein FdhE [Niallia sp. Krafla_26]|uniref:formate dehydrogenase accessory protein FdhE n=1 Tax=Niallia sp. Krafla_26 TaxID=3064703 RepID=UPI003D16C15B